MNTVSIEEIPKILTSAGERPFYLEFVKKDGTVRKMNAVSKWEHEPKPQDTKPAPYKPAEHGITILKDVDIVDLNAIRAVRWDSIRKMVIENKTYTRDGAGVFYVTETN